MCPKGGSRAWTTNRMSRCPDCHAWHTLRDDVCPQCGRVLEDETGRQRRSRDNDPWDLQRWRIWVVGHLWLSLCWFIFGALVYGIGGSDVQSQGAGIIGAAVGFSVLVVVYIRRANRMDS